jgi:TraM recognition site of TraD and TraG
MRFKAELPSLGRPSGDEHPAYAIARADDPYDELMKFMAAPDMNHRVLLGATETGFNLSAPRRNVGVLGAPRAKKTSGTAIPAVGSHRGPVVGVTTKRTEVPRAVGVMRARLAGEHGQLWHIGLDGAPAPGGYTPAGWTPISKTWLRAYMVGRSLTEAVGMGRAAGSAGFWETGAAAIVSPFLFAAGLAGRDMQWIVTTLKAKQADDVIKILGSSNEPGTKQAADDLAGVEAMPKQTKGGMWATAATALAPYSLVEALEVTKRPPVDLAAFVEGFPDEPNPYLSVPGCFSTLFVTASSLQQRLMAPLIVGLLTDLREARFALSDRDEEQDKDRPPTLLVLDDMPTLAPDRELPGTLAQSGGQGLIVMGIYHDDAQLRARWGEEGENMATTFGEQVVYRGVRDVRTLDRLSTLTGQHVINRRTSSVSVSGGSRIGYLLTGSGAPTTSESEGISPMLVPVLDKHAINEVAEQEPDAVLSFHPSSWELAMSMPYFSDLLWQRAIVACMQWLASLPTQALHRLSCPQLTKGGWAGMLEAVGGGDLVDAYWEVRDAIASKGEEWAENHPDEDDDDDEPPPDIDPSLVPA